MATAVSDRHEPVQVRKDARSLHTYSFVAPSVTPFTKYFCRKGYTISMGTEATMVTAARIEVGVTVLATYCPLP